jgi:hypothetical protein
VILYIENQQDFRLQFGNRDNFEVASNTLFADNSINQKSSQAYAIKLFRGLIRWQANKQDIVTTSITEAKLLALSQAAQEGQYIHQLLQELTIKLDNHQIQIQCNNAQTIRLVTMDIGQLQTKLRHVDIHNYWLRQEVNRGHISVIYKKSNELMADGLTKALGVSQHQRFMEQVSLKDISKRLNEQQQLRDLKSDEKLTQNLNDLFGID